MARKPGNQYAYQYNPYYQEDLRDLQNKAAIAAINRIFGVTDPGTYKANNGLVNARNTIADAAGETTINFTNPQYGRGLMDENWTPPEGRREQAAYAQRYRDQNPDTSRGMRHLDENYQYRYPNQETLSVTMPTSESWVLRNDNEDTPFHGQYAWSNNAPRDRLQSLHRYGITANNFGQGSEFVDNFLSDVPSWDRGGFRREATQNRNSIDANYNSIREDILSYFKTQLEQQHEEFQKEQRYNLARRGLTGGQSDINSGADILGAYNTGLAEATGRADSAVNDLRGRDESARLSLIDQINSGMDQRSAVSSAQNQLQSNADAVSSDMMTQALSNVFADLGSKYNLNSYVQGANKAVAGGPPRGSGGSPLNPNDYDGSVR